MDIELVTSFHMERYNPRSHTTLNKQVDSALLTRWDFINRQAMSFFVHRW